MVCKIVSDSAVNMRAAKGDTEFVSVPLTIRAGEKEFIDDNSLDVREMVDYMSNFKGKSGTACPSVDAWLQAFEGAERVLCFTITSGLSGSYNSAGCAKSMLESKRKNVKITTHSDKSRGLDAKSFGMGLYIVRSIIELHGGTIKVNSEEGKYAEFVINGLSSNITINVNYITENGSYILPNGVIIIVEADMDIL